MLHVFSLTYSQLKNSGQRKHCISFCICVQTESPGQSQPVWSYLALSSHSDEQTAILFGTKQYNYSLLMKDLVVLVPLLPTSEICFASHQIKKEQHTDSSEFVKWPTRRSHVLLCSIRWRECFAAFSKSPTDLYKSLQSSGGLSRLYITRHDLCRVPGGWNRLLPGISSHNGFVLHFILILTFSCTSNYTYFIYSISL